MGVSVRRRAVAARVKRDRQFNESWEATSAKLRYLQHALDQAVSERDGHRRMDDDGAPAVEPRLTSLYFKGCEIVWNDP